MLKGTILCLLLLLPILGWPNHIPEKLFSAITFTALNLAAYCLLIRSKESNRIPWILGLETGKWIVVLSVILLLFNPKLPEEQPAILTFLYHYMVLQFFYIAAVITKVNK